MQALIIIGRRGAERLESGFNADQERFVESLDRALSQACPTTKVRRFMETGADATGATYDRAVWNALRQLGALSAHEVEFAMSAAASFSVGKALAPVPLSLSLCAALGLREAKGARQSYDQVIIGALAATLYLDQGLTFDGGVLNGVASPCFDAGGADIALVRARVGNDSRPVLVALNAPNSIEHETLTTLDRSKPAARLRFADAEAREIEIDDAEAFFARQQARLRALIAFEQLGGAQAALETACAYARDRNAFGRPIGAQQALKHALADIWVKLELARGHCLYAAWALQAKTADFELACVSASLAASEAFSSAARTCVHVHGGFGFTWESDAHLFYRRARALEAMTGGRAALGIELSARLYRGERAAR